MLFMHLDRSKIYFAKMLFILDTNFYSIGSFSFEFRLLLFQAVPAF